MGVRADPTPYHAFWLVGTFSFGVIQTKLAQRLVGTRQSPNTTLILPQPAYSRPVSRVSFSPMTKRAAPKLRLQKLGLRQRNLFEMPSALCVPATLCQQLAAVFARCVALVAHSSRRTTVRCKTVIQRATVYFEVHPRLLLALF